ncbi:hypothetical protein [Dietzia alimentaria]|uniref:hypothetical protein n=1 Tax=Dietzia alimentaria TaxID=665550 RepID=UPI00029AF6BE|nr:hypothetical protein [Dietzia alimentaria]
MNSPALNRTSPTQLRREVAADTNEIPAGLPPGPMTTAELAAAVPDAPGRTHYRRIWHGMYRRADQSDELGLRSRALARVWPEGVLRGRSAALFWGDDSAPDEALPEIWLPRTRKTREGRIYRYGSMPPSAVTEVDGLRVTTPLRTCRDLARDLEFDDAVVSVERLCATVPELPAQLAAVAEHPAGRGARELIRVAAAVDLRSGSTASTRARLALAAARCGDFRHGYTIRLGKCTLELPLADPVARCVVLTPGGGPTPLGWAAPGRSRMQLRRAGWTVIVVRESASTRITGAGHTAGTESATAAATSTATAAASAVTADGTATASLAAFATETETVAGAGADAGGELTRSALVEDSVSERAASALRSRWSRTDVYPPVRTGPIDDPHGMWTPRRGGDTAFGW